MGKPLGKMIGAYISPEDIERLDKAVIETKSKSRSNLLSYIIRTWLDNNGY